MARRFKAYPVENLEVFKHKMLLLSKQFSNFCLLESNHYERYPYSNFGFFVAIDSLAEVTASSESSFFPTLQAFHDQHKEWLFGFLSYDLKSEIEPSLTSENYDGIGCPKAHFFIPKYLFRYYKNTLELGVMDETHRQTFETLYHSIPSDSIEVTDEITPSALKERMDEATYIEKVEALKQHIQRGDIYETNFCQEFYLENTAILTIQVYEKLNQLAKAPFGAYLKKEDLYLMCSSPERYLKKYNSKVISQPIKGTIRRGENETADALLKEALLWDPKERSENVMIVDLVRNDLSKIAKKGSVKVEELFGIYTFEQVHQMISTVVAKVDKKLPFTQILAATFPMGSMTGAPKFRAMQLIESYETVQRGLYSGAVGYVTPLGNFDFNVVIRSIIHQAEKKYTSVQVGSAITIDCKPAYEYKECLLKAKAMKAALGVKVE
jgi:para-aminobenzoate synthetase component 1